MLWLHVPHSQYCSLDRTAPRSVAVSTPSTVKTRPSRLWLNGARHAAFTQFAIIDSPLFSAEDAASADDLPCLSFPIPPGVLSLSAAIRAARSRPPTACIAASCCAPILLRHSAAQSDTGPFPPGTSPAQTETASTPCTAWPDLHPAGLGTTANPGTSAPVSTASCRHSRRVPGTPALPSACERPRS